MKKLSRASQPLEALIINPSILIMHRFAIILALLAAPTVRAGPLSASYRSGNGVASEADMAAIRPSEGSTGIIENVKRSGKSSITGDLDMGTIACHKGSRCFQLSLRHLMLMDLKGTVNVEDRQRSDKHDGITALSNEERLASITGISSQLALLI